MAQVSDRVRRLRKERGLTQEEVARLAGLTLNSYGDIERGHVRDPHLSSLEAIARALGVPIQALVSEELAIPLVEAPSEPGLASAGLSGGVDVAGVLETTAELWAEQLTRKFYDHRTLAMMDVAGFVLAAKHAAETREYRETLPPPFRAHLEAAEERFAEVGGQIWEALQVFEEDDHGRPTPPDELAARREARREELRQQLRGAEAAKAEAN